MMRVAFACVLLAMTTQLIINFGLIYLDRQNEQLWQTQSKINQSVIQTITNMQSQK